MSHKDYHVVKIMRMPHTASLAGDLPLPEYQSERAAGLDLLAAIPAAAPITVEPGKRAMIPTGIALWLPANIEGQVRPLPRSALSHGVTVLNAPYTLDGDYHGEVHVILINLGADPFVVEHGTPIAQLVFAPFAQVSLQEAAAIEPSSPTPEALR